MTEAGRAAVESSTGPVVEAPEGTTTESTVAVTSGEVAPETTVAEVAGPEATAAAESAATEAAAPEATENATNPEQGA